MSSQSPYLSLGKTHGFPADSSIDPESSTNRSDFKVRNSSTGGKIPLHGARRMVYPSRVLIVSLEISSKFQNPKLQTTRLYVVWLNHVLAK